MTRAPISREQQIELMRTARERQDARSRDWKKDPLVKRVLTEPAPGQDQSQYKPVPRQRTG